MACCGGKRRSYHRSSSHHPALAGVRADSRRAAHRSPAPSAVFFEYVGDKALTVIGSATGRRYRFASPGAVVAVDGRDSPAVAAVPGLRRVTP